MITISHQKPSSEKLEQLKVALKDPVKGARITDQVNRCPDFLRQINKTWKTIDEEVDNEDSEEEQAFDDGADDESEDEDLALVAEYYEAQYLKDDYRLWHEKAPVYKKDGDKYTLMNADKVRLNDVSSYIRYQPIKTRLEKSRIPIDEHLELFLQVMKYLFIFFPKEVTPAFYQLVPFTIDAVYLPERLRELC